MTGKFFLDMSCFLSNSIVLILSFSLEIIGRLRKAPLTEQFRLNSIKYACALRHLDVETY
jgi:hypothetical protein